MKTRLLILGSNRLARGASTRYRGVYRIGPDYQENLGPDHEVNRVFAEYCRQGGQALVLSDIRFARRVVEVYRKLDPPQSFDLVEVTPPDEDPQFAGNLLGYDVSCGESFSLLSWGLELTAIASNDFRSEPLLMLIERYFKPTLNSYGLFAAPEAAQFCLDCLTSLNELIPALFWSKQDTFEVLGVHLVS